MLGCSLPVKSRKRLAYDVIDTSATHASRVCDVTDTDCHTQNGSAHVHAFVTFTS